MLSTVAFSSAERCQLAAATLPATCSGLVAPAITLAVAGSASSQAKASSSRVCPRSFANASSFSTFGQFASLTY